MRINYLKARAMVATVPDDTARMIRAHRNYQPHRNIIVAYRAAHPLCERCLHEGRTRATEEIHHVVPVAECGVTAPGNLLALCLPCHTGIDGVPRDEQVAFKEGGD
jgi:hypothetical protein